MLGRVDKKTAHSFPLTHSLTPSHSFTHSLSPTQSVRCVWDRVYVRGSKFLYRLTNQCLCLPVFTPGRDMWTTGLVFTQLFTRRYGNATTHQLFSRDEQAWHPIASSSRRFWSIWKKKWHTRGRADKSWRGLKTAIWQAFGVLPYDNPSNKALPTPSIVWQRESRRAREYLAAYKRGCSVSEVDEVRNTIKTIRCGYKQHHVPSQAGARAQTPTVPLTPATAGRRITCGSCGVVGHNRLGCERYWAKRS